MSNVIKVGLITTLNTNIGDDFIRTGICLLLGKHYAGRTIEYSSVNKHDPFSVYPAGHPVRLARRISGLPDRLQRIVAAIGERSTSLGGSRFDDCSVIIQCGAPVFWVDCAVCEWAKPLWRDVVGRVHKQIPVLNIAAGSCYPWQSYPEISLLASDRAYIEEILSYCRLTTVRDIAALGICSSLGQKSPLLPCTAFLAPLGLRADLAEDSPILINYMSGGGHFDFGQNIDAYGWQQTVLELICRLEKRHRLRFLCHDENEFKLARQLAPQIDCLLPRSVEEYWQAVKDAKLALCNRMHASVGLAGMGIPSIAVCTDTRLLMVSQLGLPVAYVKDVSTALLEGMIEDLLVGRMSERERLLDLQEQTCSRYLEELAVHLPA